jgi:uncharacterized membrane-anchored protein
MRDSAVHLPSAPRRRSKMLIALVILQIAVLLGVTGSSYAVLWFGQEIRIATVPVDPRDPIYGDHVVLSYTISALPNSLWKESDKLPESGATLYVLMRPGASGTSGIYDAAGVYAHKPSVSNGDVVLKGRMTYSYNDTFHVDYGLETYYVPENTGKVLEQQSGHMLARVKVAPWGRSLLEGLEPVSQDS